MKVLISAYACEPNKGSEPEVGWQWANQIARFHKVWVITRSNNREPIERELKDKKNPNLHFTYFDLPYWMRFWKKGERGLFLYYYLWQIFIYFKVRSLHKRIKFDLIHHVTFVNDYFPSFLVFLQIPFVWGPIGHHLKIPNRFTKKLGLTIFLKENIKAFAKYFLRTMDPFTRFTYKKAQKILVVNKEIIDKKKDSNKYHNFYSIGIKVEEFKQVEKGHREKIIIVSAGRLLPLKGFHLTIKAFNKFQKEFPDTILEILGDGYWRDFLKRLVFKLGIENKVKLYGNLPREIALKKISLGDIFLFPSFEGAGFVFLEAMAFSIPIICLDWGGGGIMVTDECGIKIHPKDEDQVVDDLFNALLKLAINENLRKKMGEAGRKRVEKEFNWDKKGEKIVRIYEEVVVLKKNQK